MRPLSKCRALVVDMTHGGKVICEELVKRDCEVFAFDNHNTLKEVDKNRLKKMGVKLYENVKIPVEEFDIIIVQHADPKMEIFERALEFGIPVISHARAVGIILSEKRGGKQRFVEITGTNGKTTTANMLCKILSERGNVLIHDTLSTRLVNEDDEKIIFEGLSITPANVLKVYNECIAKGLDFDYAVFEVSLGGTGASDVGIVTGVYDNYVVPFYANAFNSKLQMATNMKNGVLVLNGDNIVRRFSNTFCGKSNIYGIERGENVRVKNLNESTVEGDYTVHTVEGGEVSGEFSFKLDKALFGRFQILNALAALTASLSLGIDSESACKSLGKFRGVRGRAIAELYGNGIFVDCSNRGVNIPAIITAISEAERLKKEGVFDGVIVAISGSEKAVCEIIDAERLFKLLQNFEIDNIFLSGPLGKRLLELGLYGAFLEKLTRNDMATLIKLNKPIILYFSNDA